MTMRHSCLCMAYFLTAAIFLVGPTLAASGADLVLANHGDTSYTVVIAPTASATVQHAAHELAADLHHISGADFPVSSKQPAGPAIYVGSGGDLRTAFPKLALNSLPAEGFFIRTSGARSGLDIRD